MHAGGYVDGFPLPGCGAAAGQELAGRRLPGSRKAGQHAGPAEHTPHRQTRAQRRQLDWQRPPNWAIGANSRSKITNIASTPCIKRFGRWPALATVTVCNRWRPSSDVSGSLGGFLRSIAACLTPGSKDPYFETAAAPGSCRRWVPMSDVAGEERQLRHGHQDIAGIRLQPLMTAPGAPAMRTQHWSPRGR